MTVMSWDNTYKRDNKIWGDNPSELAKFASDRIKKFAYPDSKILLDVGCGYGRDSKFLREETNIRVLGIDCSKSAIEMACASVKSGDGVEFLLTDFKSATRGPFDVIFASNLYQVLTLRDRAEFIEFVRKNLRPDGSLFLGTMSTGDPEHFGKGHPVEGDPNSFKDEKYLHFSDKRELERDFGFLIIKEMQEREFYEPRSNGTTHHHKSWLLMAQSPSL